MKMNFIYLDANFILNALISSEKTERIKNFFLEHENKSVFVTSLASIEEVLYSASRILCEETQGISSFYRYKKFVERNDYKFMENFFILLLKFLKEFKILIFPDTSEIEEVIKIMKRYHLLPNDALIAATCKYYGIKKIATFDEDFSRVDFLEIAKV